MTDTYIFDGSTGTVLVMAVNTSLAGDGRTAGFHPDARYEFKIHFDGAEDESLTYRFVFDDAGPAGIQPWSLYRLSGADARDDGAAGVLVAQGRTGGTVDGTDGVRAWAGPAADPFYLDLKHLSFIIKGLQSKTPIEYADWTPDDAASTFTGSHIDAIVLEIANTDAELRTGRDIAMWSTVKLATDAGGWHQINRAAIPMMWPLFRAIGGDDDSAEYTRDTADHPADDLATDGPRVTEMIAAATRATGNANPQAYAAAVARRLLPDVLPYRIGTPASFGFAGFNGRALSDNAPEVMYSLITNSGFPTGLTSGNAAETRSREFPYVVPATED